MEISSRLYPSLASQRKERSAKNKQLATRGEELAAGYLRDKDYLVLSRNFRSGRAGEADIVALDPEGILVFCEVKTRSLRQLEFGIRELGFESVGQAKRLRLKRVAAGFHEAFPEHPRIHRFDVIVILFPSMFPVLRPEEKPCQPTLLEPEILHLENAFC